MLCSGVGPLLLHPCGLENHKHAFAHAGPNHAAHVRRPPQGATRVRVAPQRRRRGGMAEGWRVLAPDTARRPHATGCLKPRALAGQHVRSAAGRRKRKRWGGRRRARTHIHVKHFVLQLVYEVQVQLLVLLHQALHLLLGRGHGLLGCRVVSVKGEVGGVECKDECKGSTGCARTWCGCIGCAAHGRLGRSLLGSQALTALQCLLW